MKKAKVVITDEEKKDSYKCAALLPENTECTKNKECALGLVCNKAAKGDDQKKKCIKFHT